MTRRRANRYNGELNQTYVANQQRLRSKQKCERVHAVFTIGGKAKVKEYRHRWTADRDYIIKKVRVVAGNHVPHDNADPESHNNDGCPIGSDLVIQIRKYPADFDTTEDTSAIVRLFTNEGRLRVPAGKHRDTAWAEDIREGSEELLEDEWLTVKVKEVGSTYPGDSVVITVVMEPA